MITDVPDDTLNPRVPRGADRIGYVQQDSWCRGLGEVTFHYAVELRCQQAVCSYQRFLDGPYEFFERKQISDWDHTVDLLASSNICYSFKSVDFFERPSQGQQS